MANQYPNNNDATTKEKSDKEKKVIGISARLHKNISGCRNGRSGHSARKMGIVMTRGRYSRHL